MYFFLPGCTIVLSTPRFSQIAPLWTGMLSGLVADDQTPSRMVQRQPPPPLSYLLCQKGEVSLHRGSRPDVGLLLERAYIDPTLQLLVGFCSISLAHAAFSDRDKAPAHTAVCPTQRTKRSRYSPPFDCNVCRGRSRYCRFLDRLRFVLVKWFSIWQTQCPLQTMAYVSKRSLFGIWIYICLGHQVSGCRSEKETPHLIEICDHSLVKFALGHFATNPCSDPHHSWMVKIEMTPRLCIGCQEQPCPPADSLCMFPYLIFSMVSTKS